MRPHLSIARPDGRLDLWLGPRTDRRAALDLDARVAGRGRDVTERVAGAEGALWLKGGPLGGEPALRHGLRARLGLGPPPRAREFAVLRALPALGLEAAVPRAAGVLWRRGLPRRQWLATAEVEGARPLLELDRAPATAALERASAELARLHAAGRRHGDAHPRNLLVRADGRPVWIDVWRHAAPRPRPVVGAAAGEDLRCLLDGALELTPDERARCLARYRAARPADRRGPSSPVAP